MFNMKNSRILIIFLLFVFVTYLNGEKKAGDKPDWAKKDIRDYSDLDLERLFDQWEENEEPLEPDELPEHLRPAPKIDFSNMADPEAVLKMAKKGRTLMAFVTVSGNPNSEETEKITALWQSSLLNNHINAERYTIGENRVIFMFKDGSQAWEAKDFLIKQEKLEVVIIENKEYYGVYSTKVKPVKSKNLEKSEL